MVLQANQTNIVLINIISLQFLLVLIALSFFSVVQNFLITSIQWKCVTAYHYEFTERLIWLRLIYTLLKGTTVYVIRFTWLVLTVNLKMIDLLTSNVV